MNPYKKTVSIYNENKGTYEASLNELRDELRNRRKAALNPLGKKMVITVITKNRDHQQPAAHYNSFDFDKMGLDQVIEIYNAGGMQVATRM